MPDPETASLTEYAVLWPFAGNDNNGNPTRGAAVELSPLERDGVRWEESKRAAVSGESEPISKTVTVGVARDITVGSQMWRGRLRNLPSPLTDLFVVIEFSKAMDIRGRVAGRTVRLMRIQ